MTPIGVFFIAIFPLVINDQALCQQLHFVPVGRLGLVGGRLIRLGWAALAGPCRFRLFPGLGRGLFCFRSPSPARLFGFLVAGRRLFFSGSPGLLSRGIAFLFNRIPGRLPLLGHELVNLVGGDHHVAGSRLGGPGLFWLRCFGCRASGSLPGNIRGLRFLGARVQFFIRHSLSSFS